MKYLFLWVTFFLGLPSSLLAQKEDYSWVIPSNTVLHFTDSIPWIEEWPRRIYEITECHASISDSSENLILYTNAGRWRPSFSPDTGWFNTSTIRNEKHDTIINGDKVNLGESVTNGALFLRYKDKVYLFSLDTYFTKPPVGGWRDSLYYIRPNMSIIEQIDGVWEVTTKNTILSPHRLVERLAAVRHANGQDWWIITHDWKNNIFHVFLFKDGKIEGPFSQQTGQVFKDVGKQDNLFFTGEITVSLDGSKLLLANSANLETREYGAELFHFDRCCGKVTFWKGLKKRKYYGASFSPNGKFIYLAPIYWHTYQYEMDAEDIEATEIQVSPDSIPREWGWRGGQFELGPDGRIYCASQSSRYIGAILYPDRKGKACEFKPDFIPYGKDGSGGLGLPSFPNYRLGALAPTYYRHDTTVCPDKKTAIGIPPDCDYAYEWSPTTGLSDTSTATPTVKINQDMTYIRRTFSPHFGCTLRYDTFFVKVLEKTVPPCTSNARPENSTEKTFTIYPNPAQETFTIRYAVQNHYHLTLLDITGRELLSFRLNSSGEHTLDVSTLPEGIYILKADDRFSEKLVIVR